MAKRQVDDDERVRQLATRIPHGVYQQLKHLAVARHAPINVLVAEAITDLLKKHNWKPVKQAS